MAATQKRARQDYAKFSDSSEDVWQSGVELFDAVMCEDVASLTFEDSR